MHLMVRELKDDPDMEVGMNLQFGRELVEEAGLKWEGAYVWDPRTCISYHTAYEPKVREKLVDLYMEDFKAVFGRYPKSAGAWIVDTHTLQYLHDKYGVIAAAECPDQWRTDCYTLWGAPVNTPYVVARKNAYMPAQTVEKSMGVAMWRMAGGSDPIYHYEGGVATYPYYSMQMPAFFTSAGDYGRWWLEQVAQTPLSLGCIAPGQEVDWVAPVLEDCAKMITEYRSMGLVRTETLSQTAGWFLRENQLTPPSGYNAMQDWPNKDSRPAGWSPVIVAEYLNNNVKDQAEVNKRIIENLEATLQWNQDHKACWYSSRFYRCGLIWEGDNFRLRNLYLYDEDVPDNYLHEASKAADNVYMALPVVDAMQWSSIADSKLAGIRLVVVKADGSREALKCGNPRLDTPDNRCMIVTVPLKAGGEARIRFDEEAATFELLGNDAPGKWAVELSWFRQPQAFWKKADPSYSTPNMDFFKIDKVEAKALIYYWCPPTTLHQPELGLPRQAWTYAVKATSGTFSKPQERVVVISPENGKIQLLLNTKAARAK